MKKIFYIALLFSACKGETGADQANYPCAIYAVFESGKGLEADLVCPGNAVAEANPPEWLWGDGDTEVFTQVGNRLLVESGRYPQPGETCTLRWHDAPAAIEIPLHFPPQPEVEVLSDDTLQTGQEETIEVQWTNLGDDYEYVLLLECLEEDAVPIAEQIGNFDAVHSGPKLENTLSLEKQNFTFLGRHRLVIYALNRAFTDIYFEDPSDIRGLLKMPMSNLPNAKGYIMCVTAVELQIVVE